MSITVTQLAAFVAVVRGGSVTAAAEALGVTQPTVSSAIAALSKELDCELLERSGRGVQPTDAGREFAAYAGEVVGLLEAGRRAARETAERSTRELRVAVAPTAAETFVPALLQRFGDAHADVAPRLTVAGPQDVLEAVTERRVDLAIIGHDVGDQRFSCVPIRAYELVCVAPAGDALLSSAPRPVAVQALADRVWLLREQGSSTRRASELYLQQQQLSPDTLTLGSNAAIKRAVISGLGVALLVREIVEDELRDGALVQIAMRDPPPAGQWYAVSAAAGPQRPVVGELLQFSGVDRKTSE
jgi:LysR family transcriptional regulator, low CO2-responsive transcriptional regulator